MMADNGSPFPLQTELNLPSWVAGFLQAGPALFPKNEQRLELVLELTRRHVEHGSGGPFGAAIFETVSGRLVAVGVNRVEPLNSSLAHAEIMAIALAQKRLARFDLGSDLHHPHQLVSSAQPCIMCFGATLWSGVTDLVFGALSSDVEKILGFDEGPVPSDWQAELTRRGITVTGGLQRDQAVAILHDYRQKSGLIYNSRRGFQHP